MSGSTSLLCALESVVFFTGARAYDPGEMSAPTFPVHCRMSPAARAVFPVLAGGLVLIVLLLTMSPGVQWGDAGKLVRLSVRASQGGDLSSTAGAHLLLNYLGALAVWVLPMEPARAHIAMTCALGALAATFTGLAVLRMTGRPAAGAGAALLLGFAHLSWFTAAIGEHYPLFMALFAILVERLLAWRQGPTRGLASQIGLLLGLLVCTNLLIPGLVPALAVLFFQGLRGQAREKRALNLLPALALVSAWALLGAAPLIGVAIGDMRVRAPSLVWADITDARFHGYHVWNASLGAVLRGTVRNLGLLGYQFPLLGGAAVLVGIARLRRRDRGLLFALSWCALLVVGMTSSYMAQRAAFVMTTALVPVALLAGAGLGALDDFIHRHVGVSRRPVPALVLGLLVAGSVTMRSGLYHIAPRAARAAGKTITQNPIPLRNDARYFLTPWKQDMDGARRFSRDALTIAGPGDTIIADFTMEEPMFYQRDVNGMGAGVRFVDVERPAYQKNPVGFVRERLRLGRVFLTRDHPAYRLDVLRREFALSSSGPLAQVRERADPPLLPR